MGKREQGRCQKNWSGRKAGATGLHREKLGEPFTHSCLLWTLEASCCELECVLARRSVTEPSNQGRPGRGWAAFQLFLKAQSITGSLHLQCLWSLLGRSFRSPRSWERGQAGSKAEVVPQGPGSCQVGSTGDLYLARPSSSSQHLHTSAIWCSQMLTPAPLPNRSKENTRMPGPISSQKGQSLSQGVPHARRQVFEAWDHASTSSSIALDTKTLCRRLGI